MSSSRLALDNLAKASAGNTSGPVASTPSQPLENDSKLSPPPRIISRSLRACELCRKTKAKCCGNLPCKRCSRSRRNCVYSDGKLIAQKKTVEVLEQELAFVKSRNEALEDLLHSVCTSPRSGLQGKMYASEATMMTSGGGASIEKLVDQQKLSSLSFDTREEEESLVKRLAWPPIPVADSLIHYYFNAVHPTFPLLWKPNILATYTSWSRNPLNVTTYNVDDHAIINIMFAISVIHSRALQIYHQWPQMDYEVFISRAKVLVPTADTMHSGSTMKEIQLKALLGTYYVLHHQIDSAWGPIASGVRSSMSMGFHSNTEREPISASQRENQNRIWWTLISLERLLGDFTGRPSGIDPNIITCSLPSLKCESKFDDCVSSSLKSPLQQSQYQTHVIQEFSSNTLVDASSEIYAPFVYRMEMEIIAHRSMYEFQKPFLVKMTDKDLRTRVSNLNTNLSNTLYRLPKYLDFTSDVNLAYDAISPDVHRIILAMTYHHTRMIVHRPYLLKPRIQENPSLLSFELSAAYYCISSAQAIVTLIPNDLQFTGAAMFYVWWGYLNPICRAAAILLMEVLFQSHGDVSRCKQLLHMYRKAMRFLQSMSKTSEAALNAWETFDRTFNEIFVKVLREVENHSVQTAASEVSCSVGAGSAYTGSQKDCGRDTQSSSSFERFCTQARQVFMPTIYDPFATEILGSQFSSNEYHFQQTDLWQQYIFPSLEEMNSFAPETA